MTKEIQVQNEVQKLVNWNSKIPVGSEMAWYSSCGKIRQLRVITSEYARLDANGKAVVDCVVVGISELSGQTATIFLDQLKPITKGE